MRHFLTSREISADNASSKLSWQVGKHVIAVTIVLSVAFGTAATIIAQRLAIADVKANINHLVSSAVPFASWAAYATSPSAAKQAIDLLADTPWILQATITDDLGDALASYTNPDKSLAILAVNETRKIPLHIDKSKNIYGHLEIHIHYRVSSHAKLLVATSVLGILATSFFMGVVLFLVFRGKVLTPLESLEKSLRYLPRENMAEFQHKNFGSKELNDLSRAFIQAWAQTQSALDDKNRAVTERHKALNQRAMLADAVDLALQQCNIFLAIFENGSSAPIDQLGASIPDEIYKRLDNYGLHQNPTIHASDIEIEGETSWNISVVKLGKSISAVLGRDVTLVKKLAENAETARRIESIASMTSGVAHDFNNVLAITIGALQMEMYNKSPRNIQVALEAAQRGASLVRRLLDASRMGTEELEPINQVDVVKGIQNQLAEHLGDTHQLKVTIETNKYVLAEYDRLESTILNLIINARDASPVGSQIELLVREASAAEIRENDLETEKQYVLFRISDAGSGIPEEYISRVLEPFFTTKPRNQGSGLGLSLANAFALRSKGKLALQSKLGVGTRASLYLPVTNGGSALLPHATRTNVPHIENALFGMKILIVEDEEDLLELFASFLQTHGATVIGAESLAQANRLLFSNRNEPPDIVISDILLPDGSGTDLISKITQGEYCGRLILMSGNYDINLLTKTDRNLITAFLDKPISLEKLLTVLITPPFAESRAN